MSGTTIPTETAVTYVSDQDVYFQLINEIASPQTTIVSTQPSGSANTATTFSDIDRGVRRPHRGLEIKKETYAYIQVVGGSTLKNSSVAGDPNFTSNLSIIGVSESRAEKAQSVLTFGKDYIYFFGEQPVEMQFTAILLNSKNFRWEEEWWYNYENYFRGTKLASRGEKILIRIEDSLIYGYMTTCSTQKDANDPFVVRLNFTVHVSSHIHASPGQIGSDKPLAYEGNIAGNVDMLPQSATPILIGSESAAVAAYNIKKYNRDRHAQSAGGALAKFKSSVEKGLVELSATTQDYIDFLYGRNLVIPAGNNFSSGTAQFIKKSTPLNTIPTAEEQNGVASYTDNIDEYPFSIPVVLPMYPKGNKRPAVEVPDLPEESKSTFRSIMEKGAGFAAFQLATTAAQNSYRKRAFSKAGNASVYRYPNEIFSAGIAAPYYTKK